MGIEPPFSLAESIEVSTELLMIQGTVVDTGRWQGVPTAGKPDLQTREVIGVYWAADMPQTLDELREQVKPNLPWADEHFRERVGRVPSNPGEAYKNWPWWQQSESMVKATQDENHKFTHTYQERIWPRWAGDYEYKHEDHETPLEELRFDRQHYGIRYRYGDLDDLVQLLSREPHTRQAFLPIFFPEDTGAVHGGRIPCTIGYHFLLRDQKFHCFYTIRSCDLVRHFRDDIYLAVRLAMRVLNEVGVRNPTWSQVQMGTLHFNCFSLHVHRGDEHLVRP
jgi:hypothetical protein